MNLACKKNRFFRKLKQRFQLEFRRIYTLRIYGRIIKIGPTYPIFALNLMLLQTLQCWNLEEKWEIILDFVGIIIIKYLEHWWERYKKKKWIYKPICMRDLSFSNCGRLNWKKVYFYILWEYSETFPFWTDIGKRIDQYFPCSKYYHRPSFKYSGFDSYMRYDFSNFWKVVGEDPSCTIFVRNLTLRSWDMWSL